MKNYWIVPGSEVNWRQAFIAKGIWGLRATKNHRLYWAAIAPNDIILFYVSGKIKKVVGYGTVRSKFFQNAPLWEAEIKEGVVKWPFRFEFDVEFLLDKNAWKDAGVSIPPGGEFRQPLIIKERDEITSIISQLNPDCDSSLLDEIGEIREVSDDDVSSPDHETVKGLLYEIGRLQSYIADKEFAIGNERLDVVWRRLKESVPTFVFEVHVSGDLYHALGKLKHAYDIWNSRVFVVVSPDNVGAVKQLLAGTFHELQPVLKIVLIQKIKGLYKSKRDLFNVEKELGLVP
jgi:hypothetical protein